MAGDLYVPGSGGGFVHSGATELNRQLQQGDGIIWTGDPRLELRVGVLTEKATRRTARRYEVWRTMEDGREERIGTWRLDEFHTILHDVATMRAGAEGKIPSVTDRIDKANEAHERKIMDKYRDSVGQVIDHGARLLHDRTQPKNVFRGMPGRRDEKR